MKKRTKRFLVIGILISSLGAADAMASQEIEYRPYLRVGGEYNDNILFTRKDAKDDFLANVAPGLNLNYRTELLELKSEGNVLFRRYFEEDDYDREEYLGDLRVKYRLTEKLMARGRFNYRQDFTLESRQLEFDDPIDLPAEDDVEPGTERFYSERKRINTFAAFRYQLTERSDLDLLYRYVDTRYDFEENTDYDIHRISPTFLRRLAGERDIVGARAAYVQYSSDVSDADIYEAALLWNHKFTETMTLESELGASYVDRTYLRGDRDDDEWRGLANIRFIRRGEDNQLKVGFRQNYQPGSSGTAVNVPRFYGEFEQDITERFQFLFRWNLYLESEDSDFNYDDGTVYFDVVPSLRYRLTRDHSVSLAYSYTIDYDQDLDEDRDRQRNRVWLTFEFGFPGRR